MRKHLRLLPLGGSLRESPLWTVSLKNEHLPLFYLSISSLNILLQMLKSLYEKQKLPSLTLTYVHKLGQRFLRKEIEQSRFYKNIARVDIFEANSSFFIFGLSGPWRVAFNLQTRRKRRACVQCFLTLTVAF